MMSYVLRFRDWSSDVCSSERPLADDAKLVAGIELGPQGFAEPPRILRDQCRRGGQDLRGRAVILREPDHRRAGEILVEAQDIRDLRAAPAVHRLVVVTDDTDILARLREQAEPEILDGVGVLIFVDEDIFEAVLILRSEEHTSELQSLMRISYAVFCLKKKKSSKHIH